MKEFKNSFKVLAENIKEYKTRDINALINEYVDEENTFLKECFLSALMLRYWGYIYKFKTNSSFLRLQEEDFISWIYEAIKNACEYKAWRNPKNSLFMNPKAPNIIINKWMETIRMREFTAENRNKRRITYLCELIDLQDEANQLEDNVCPNRKMRDVIQGFIDRDKLLEALVIDAICFWDTNVNDDLTFSKIKLLKHLRNINNDFFINEFINNYSINRSSLIKLIDRMSCLTNKQLNQLVNKILGELRCYWI